MEQTALKTTTTTTTVKTAALAAATDAKVIVADMKLLFLGVTIVMMMGEALTVADVRNRVADTILEISTQSPATPVTAVLAIP